MADVEYIENVGNKLDKFLGRAYAHGESTVGIFAKQLGDPTDRAVAVFAVERGWGSLAGIATRSGPRAQHVGTLLSFDYMDDADEENSWSGGRIDEMLRDAGLAVGGDVDLQCFDCI